MPGFSDEKTKKRADEIKRITELFGFDAVFELNFPTTQLDRIPMSELVTAISDVFKSFEPEEVYVPHPADLHTDHGVVFNAVAGCTKWFRYPSVKRVLAYEMNRPGFRGGWLVLIMRLLSIPADYVRIVPQTLRVGYGRWAQGVVFG